MKTKDNNVMVVALGGNALSPPDRNVSIAEQFRYVRQSLTGLRDVFLNGYKLAITHGNGPQVGDALLRVEKAKEFVSEIPLEVLVAETQGSIGYMIEQSLQNLLCVEGVKRDVITVVTQVLVDKDDTALKNPTKFVGGIFTESEAKELIEKEGWAMKPMNKDNLWRRVVGSPKPISIVNGHMISELVHSDAIVIAAGGGGIPVYQHSALGLKGIDAVIDKDLASAILAKDIEADNLIILTNIDSVRINFGKPNEKALDCLPADKAREYIEAGQFQAGSMGPKIEAAIQFVSNGGKRAIICHLEHLSAALKGSAGTTIIP